MLIESEESKFPKSACGGLLKDCERFPSAVHRGERVYFCNSACLEAFLSAPDDFMAGKIEHPEPNKDRGAG